MFIATFSDETGGVAAGKSAPLAGVIAGIAGEWFADGGAGGDVLIGAVVGFAKPTGSGTVAAGALGLGSALGSLPTLVGPEDGAAKATSVTGCDGTGLSRAELGTGTGGDVPRSTGFVATRFSRGGEAGSTFVLRVAGSLLVITWRGLDVVVGFAGAGLAPSASAGAAAELTGIAGSRFPPIRKYPPAARTTTIEMTTPSFTSVRTLHSLQTLELGFGLSRHASRVLAMATLPGSRAKTSPRSIGRE
jgi:hypothetical protein